MRATSRVDATRTIARGRTASNSGAHATRAVGYFADPGRIRLPSRLAANRCHAVPPVRAAFDERLAEGSAREGAEVPASVELVAAVHAAARADTPGRANDHRAAVRRKVRRSTDAMLRRRAPGRFPCTRRPTTMGAGLASRGRGSRYASQSVRAVDG